MTNPTFRPILKSRSLNWCSVLLLAFILSGCCTCYTNLDQYKQDLRNYYATRYFSDIEKQVRAGENYLDHRSQTQPNAKYAIVLDIDETSLSNWSDMASNLDFGFNAAECEAWERKEQATAIDAVLRLSQDAQAHQVAVFFITGRHEKLRQCTEENLQKAGYSHWQALYLKPDDSKLSVTCYKTGARKDITAQGYTIVLNVGDQWSDLNGGYSEKRVKLPNPFYYIK